MKALFKNFIFVLKRFKTSSILNILGLSAAFAVFAVVMMQVHYDFSFNHNFEKLDRIHVFNRFRVAEGSNAPNISTPIAKEIAEKFAEVESYCLTQKKQEAQFDIQNSHGDKTTQTTISTLAGLGFLDVFTPNVLIGSPKEALAEKGKAILSESTAKQFFGDENPIGKVFYEHNSDSPITVVAIIEDFPKNCTLKNGVFLHLADNPRNNYSFEGYFLISNLEQFLNRVNSVEYWGQEEIDHMKENPQDEIRIQMIPLSKLHLQFPDRGEGSLNTTLALLAIGIVTLVIAYINFINFSVAMAPARVRTLNIQKILGASTFSLRLAIVAEAAIFSCIAFGISLLYITFFKNGPINTLFSVDLTLSNNIPTLATLGCAAIILGLLFGIYPAYYITSFHPVDAIKGSGIKSARSSKLRGVLIIFQFMAAITLIIAASFISIQLKYMQNYSWGIQKENVVYVKASTDWGTKLLNTDVKTFGEELKKDSRIIDYTSSQFIPGRIQMGWGREFEGVLIGMTAWPVAPNFLSFFGVEMAEGKDFSEFEDDIKRVIFNQCLMDKYGFKDVIGKDFQAFEMSTIVGIVKDINFESLKISIAPMVFATGINVSDNIVFLKLSGEDVPGAIKQIESTWNKFSKEPFDMHFLDENMDKLYQSENNLAKLITIFSIITILIAVMGVYGLITFNSRYRSKEIAIRKVNGAEEKEVILMLNKDILIQFFIAFVIAIPLAYYIVSQWVDSFAYHTPIHWWVFLVAGVIVFLITVITVSWQSWKAAITNPVESLKND